MALMDGVVEDLETQARQLRALVAELDGGAFKRKLEAINRASDHFARAWSGSFLGYQSTIYYKGFLPPAAGDHYSSEWGRGSENWVEHAYEAIWQALEERAAIPDEPDLDQMVATTLAAVRDAKLEVLAALDALVADSRDERLLEVRSAVRALELSQGREALALSFLPKGASSRDTLAIHQGAQVPVHLEYLAMGMSVFSVQEAAVRLEELATQAYRYLVKRRSIKGELVTNMATKIFIGHGRSASWMELKEFLRERLNLEVSEFNVQSTAGVSTGERLMEMLDESRFAFLVMTGEDEHADSRHHARENVVHEVGLFQGRLGFRRAIVVLEEGCAEFSNIVGLGQIRFEKGRIASAYEEIRRVLEREHII